MALNVRSASLLAGVLLGDVEQIVARTAARMQELLSSYAGMSCEDLIPVLLADTRHLLEAIGDPAAGGARAELDHRASAETRAGQGVTRDDLLKGWQVGLEVVREEAHAKADELGIGDCVLLDFVEATLRWGDVGLRALISAYREVEIGELGRLAEEQAALRRVATMVARESPPEEVLAKVAEEAGQLLRADTAVIHRFDADGLGTVVGTWGKANDAFPVGRRTKLDGESATASVYRTQRPVRVESYEHASGAIAEEAKRLGLRCAVACPLFVTGRAWGAMTAGSSSPQPMPAGTESRMAEFTELAAAAISNLQARAEVERLAEEQAALRRVATMVAHERSPEEVLAGVVEEVGRISGAETAVIHRFDPDGKSTIVASYGKLQESFWVGSRWKLEGNSVAAGVSRTARPTRFDDYETSDGSIAVSAQNIGIRSGVGSPIVVNGRLWGVIAAGTSLPEPLPTDAEPRMAKFTELAATAISNVQARSDLAASRARIIATGDEQRRRVARDLHDGAQQRLVSTILTLKLASDELARDQHDAAVLVGEALGHAQAATDELRELARGILPAVLTHGGLDAAVRVLASRMSIPVEVDVAVGRLPSEVEATAYFIVAEALTNVSKHSGARHAAVSAQLGSRSLQVEVRDDGVGGAQPDGSGLVGLFDRLALLDGSLRVDSPADGGTLIAAVIPVAATPPIESGARSQA
ncbi:MAG TPA: GAF domain-containing protein [Solirubrobacteraceae bacterium]|nr:GAF domain-containing protein [Solirubrobacteraceae bacterium]